MLNILLQNFLGENMSESDTELRRILASNIRTIRLDKGMSQEQFAIICELHRTYIGSVERLERNVTLSTLVKFANSLGVSVIDLLTQKDN